MKELTKKFSLNLIRFIPFTLLVSVLGLIILPKDMLKEFFIALILIFMGVFLIDLGSKSAISRIASDTSKVVLKKRKIVFYIFMAFVLGVIVAVSEPNTWIMSHYLNGFISEWIFILSVAIGIGIMLIIAMLRILFKASIKSVFIILYLATLTIAAITSIRNPVMTLLAFDSGGVIPGLVLIPALIGFGVSVILIEPSIRILFNHILEETVGSINRRFLYGSFIISMILALIIISLRIIFSISIWWIIIPGYLIAIILSLFSSDIFLQISFDAAGSISGFLTIGFILPFLMGLSNINNAFGNIIIIQLMPLIVIMSLALIMKKEIYSTPKKGKDDIINI